MTLHMTGEHKKISIFMSFSGDGGVERMMINLMKGFIDNHYAIDLVLAKARGSYIDMIPAGVNIIKTGTSHTYTSMLALMAYCRKSRPDVLLVAKHRAGLVAAMVRRLTGVPGRLVLRLGTTLSAAMVGKNRMQRWLWYKTMRTFYPQMDKIIAVSQGVADDIADITGIPADQIEVIHNPVVTPDLASQARQPVTHPWFKPGSPGVIMGIGRLTRQKDFPTLLRAFAKVRQHLSCRLMILGEGHEREHCKSLAGELGIAEHVELPGFVTNPYAYLSKACLFVLSSRWEGSPNALTEAMALGIPVVATDCQSGPREILQNGRIGRLVPVGNAEDLAEAMLETIRHPQLPDKLQSAVSSYTIEASTLRYLQAMGIKSVG